MKVDFTGRHFHIDDRLKSFAQRKLAKLTKVADEPIDVHLVLEVEKRRHIAELHVHHRHGVLQANEEAETLKDAILASVEKIEKQARRARKKFQGKKRRSHRAVADLGWPLDVLDGASVSAGTTPRIMKTDRLPIKPMTIDEAALEIERSKNEFFVFLDSGTERVSVLYRRKDSHYGLISPEY